MRRRKLFKPSPPKFAPPRSRPGRATSAGVALTSLSAPRTRKISPPNDFAQIKRASRPNRNALHQKSAFPAATSLSFRLFSYRLFCPFSSSVLLLAVWIAGRAPPPATLFKLVYGRQPRE